MGEVSTGSVDHLLRRMNAPECAKSIRDGLSNDGCVEVLHQCQLELLQLLFRSHLKS